MLRKTDWIVKPKLNRDSEVLQKRTAGGFKYEKKVFNLGELEQKLVKAFGLVQDEKTLTKTKDKSFAADKNTCEEKQAEFQVKKAMGTL